MLSKLLKDKGMPNRKSVKMTNLIISTDGAVAEQVEPEIIDDYKSLNDKCDVVITKIKTRKQKPKK